VIRVLVADDHPVFRAGLAAVLGRLSEVEVVGEAATGAEAIALARELEPDVCVMDLHMPEVNGIEATRELVASGLRTAVLVLTMLEDDESVFAALRAGARGYLVKGAERAELERAVAAVAHGEVIVGPAVAARVSAFFAGGREGAPADPFPELTAREREILDLVARGLTNAAIASRLVLAPKTVRNHVSSVFLKLQVADRSAAIVRAREVGYGGS